MDRQQLQELIEGLTIAALDGGTLAGKVFRHNDDTGAVVADMITVRAEAPEPQLDGPMGNRVDVEIEMRNKTPEANAAIHGEAFRRITNYTIVRAAALAVGFDTSDDLYILNEEISGDRAETKNLRKRSITVPFLTSIRTDLTDPGILTITPATGLVTTGEEGGPFSPDNKVFTLENTGDTSLVWSAEVDVAWLDIDDDGGTLAPGATATVTVSLNADAEDLAEAAWIGLVTFTNATNETSTTRAVGLIVGTTAGETVTRKTGSYTISNGAAGFTITFPAAFDSTPAFADMNIVPPSGQPAVGIHSITRTASQLTVVLDTSVPAAGYVANWFALLE